MNEIILLFTASFISFAAITMIYELIGFKNIFWKVKYRVALHYARRYEKEGGKDPLVKMLEDIRDQAENASYENQYPLMMVGYQKVAERQFWFGRWICPICFFISMNCLIAAIALVLGIALCISGLLCICHLAYIPAWFFISYGIFVFAEL